MCSVTSQGSPHTRFQRALKTRNLLLIRAAALELPQPLRLHEALEVCLVYRDAAPERYDQAAMRWIGRYCAERPQLTLAHVDGAVEAFDQLRSDPEAGLERLQALAGGGQGPGGGLHRGRE